MGTGRKIFLGIVLIYIGFCLVLIGIIIAELENKEMVDKLNSQIRSQEATIEYWTERAGELQLEIREMKTKKCN